MLCPRFRLSISPLWNSTRSLSTWKDTGLSSRYGLLSGVSELKFLEPTTVQQTAIPAILDGEDVVITGQTGSGKTVAFVAPLLQQLKVDEVERNIATRTGRPRALILSPSRELSLQVLSVVKALSHHAKVRSMCVTSGAPRAKQMPGLSSDMDVVVATPGRLLRYIKQKDVQLSDVRYVVVDEADTMVVDFEDELKEILRPLQQRRLTTADAYHDEPPPVQFVLAAATLPGAALTKVQHTFPGIHIVKSGGSHQLPSQLAVEHLPVSGELTAKTTALMKLFVNFGIDGRPSDKRTLIFANTVSSCRALSHFLDEAGIPSACLHGDIPAKRRALEYSKFLEERCSILVCTDAAARGLDLQDVQHIVMFDFPKDPGLYLHRAGRAGRAGAKGRVTAFVQKRDTQLAKRILAAVSKQAAVIGKRMDVVRDNEKVNVLKPMRRKLPWKRRRQPLGKKRWTSRA